MAAPKKPGNYRPCHLEAVHPCAPSAVMYQKQSIFISLYHAPETSWTTAPIPIHICTLTNCNYLYQVFCSISSIRHSPRLLQRPCFTSSTQLCVCFPVSGNPGPLGSVRLKRLLACASLFPDFLSCFLIHLVWQECFFCTPVASTKPRPHEAEHFHVDFHDSKLKCLTFL